MKIATVKTDSIHIPQGSYTFIFDDELQARISFDSSLDVANGIFEEIRTPQFIGKFGHGVGFSSASSYEKHLSDGDIIEVIVRATADLIEGESENIEVIDEAERDAYRAHLEKLNALEEIERVRILDESDRVEERQGERAAEEYFDREFEAKIGQYRPRFDESQIKTRLVDMSNPHMAGRGNILITYKPLPQ